MHETIGHSAGRVHRVIRRHNDWTLKEHEVLISHWPDVNTIRRRIPHRSTRAIRAFAGKCNLTNPRHIWTAAQDAKLRKLAAEGNRPKEIAEILGLTLGQVTGRMRYARIRVARRPPAQCADPLINAVRQRAYALNMTLADLDRSLGKRRTFQQASGKQRVKLVHVARAVRAMGGRFIVEWIDDDADES